MLHFLTVLLCLGDQRDPHDYELAISACFLNLFFHAEYCCVSVLSERERDVLVLFVLPSGVLSGAQETLFS